MNDIRASDIAHIAPVITESIPHVPEIVEPTTIANDNEETTTQTMDKVALDLYAHLVNENSNMDSSTGSIIQYDASTPDTLVRNPFTNITTNK